MLHYTSALCGLSSLSRATDWYRYTTRLSLIAAQALRMLAPYRACLGMQRLAREYTPERLEAACARALSIRSPNLQSVTSILKKGLDRQQVLPSIKPAVLTEHENVRGPDYYH
jgi:hypothetical protein